MSPPPRHEAEDYLSLHASHSGKKKHHTRAPVSPLAVSDRIVQASMAKGYQGTPDSQQRFRDGIRPPIVLPAENSESPAVSSLRRLSEATKGKPVDRTSLNVDEAPQPVFAVLESFFTASNTNSSTRKNSVGDPTIPAHGLRRRSTAFRDGDRRRPSKSATKPTVPGLGIPATITLRKATGLFSFDAGPKASMQSAVGESAAKIEDTLSSPTTCTLAGFGPHLLDNPDQTLNPQIGAQSRKPSSVSTKGLELLRYVSASEMPSNRRQSLAETAVTIANIFPSPAILASPIKSAPPSNEIQRRLSVVQIQSRKSLHQVIWREDDASSGSGTSSDPVSPTGSLSIKIPESIESSPAQRSIASSKAGTRRNSTLSCVMKQNTPLDALSKGDSSIAVHAAVSHPEAQMIHWSWGATVDTPDGNTGNIDIMKGLGGTYITQGPRLEEKCLGTASALPQLCVPDEEEDTPISEGSGFVRRASFAIDPSSLASIGPGRELGSRRSISVQPISISRLGEDVAINAQRGSNAGRRFSRVG